MLTKDTENSDYYADGNDEAQFGMVLQHYSTFNHIEKTHIAVKLSWEDGAVELKDGMAQAKLKAKVYPVNLENQKIIWKSSDENIAKVDRDGNITAVAPGEVLISATLAREDKTLVAKLSVRQSVSEIFLPTSTITLYEGSTGRLLSAMVFPENATNKNVVWKSKNTKIARVDQTGRVKPVGVGMTEIIATTEDGSFEGKCFVNVVNSYVDVQEIELMNSEDMFVNIGKSVNAIVTVSPSNARNKTLKWSSDDNSIASVSQTGRIR
ncbi:MAG: Ig-like domain-containing protein, partial [Clostridia bacterium]|nr:Ig-like domain-containing protein [Clostridia bacterium]